MPAASAPTADRVRLRLELSGRVQGVGFRPQVHRLARELGLAGFARNGARGLVIEVEGGRAEVEQLAHRLPREAPPRAAIEELRRAWLPPAGEGEFELLAGDPREVTHGQAGAGLPVAADLASCEDCLREVLDPADRRFRYAFTSCAACGPRWSVLVRPPWERAHTAMAGFALCAACQAEYRDPRDRRFHAQTIACAACGPRLALWDPRGAELAQGDEALVEAARLVGAGGLLLLQGLGGFQLVCDAGASAAVERVRRLKDREAKPLALLVADLAAARALCQVGAEEAALLASPAAPIVLLRRRADAAGPCQAVAPGLRELGVMLPCTPLHHLLAREVGRPLVATSANPPGDPMLVCPREALTRLGAGVDRLLVHDRPILRRVDDSLARVAGGRPLLLRRARGWAPEPIPLAGSWPPLLAAGGHLKSTVGVACGRRAHLSPHLGDLDGPAARAAHAQEAGELCELQGVEPAAIACDLHPHYASTRWAEVESERRGAPLVRVQHHEAHVLACAAEHGLEPPFLGLAWDGTGLGSDGTVWGGEALWVQVASVRRVGWLRPFRLPGGERAAREPRRAALGLLHAAGELGRSPGLASLEAFAPGERALLEAALERGAQAPWTSSVGRLFDAVASLTGLCQRARWEAEGALLLEQAADDLPPPVPYPLPLGDDGALDWGPLLAAILADVAGGAGPGPISARFHEALAEAAVALARRAGARAVVLAGGCFQNRRLLERAAARLAAAGFEPRWPERLPPNDGGLALGQLAAAARWLTAQEKVRDVPGSPG